jgi:putative transposase
MLELNSNTGPGDGSSGRDSHIPESVFSIGWPRDWPNHKPIVKILCYSLMPNHYHLLLKEIRNGGISKFLHKLGTGYTNYFNLKYEEVGGVFQGSYKARTIDGDLYLKYLSVYIQILNPFELYRGGRKQALREYNNAIDFAIEYPFCSLADYIGGRKSLILDKDILGQFFRTTRSYKEFVNDSIRAKDFDNILGSLKID